MLEDASARVEDRTGVEVAFVWEDPSPSIERREHPYTSSRFNVDARERMRGE